MNPETSRHNLTLHYCVVEEIHDNGLVTVLSKKGRRFNKVNVIRPGTEFDPEPGNLVALISDGTQHLILGEFPEKTDGNYRQSNQDFDNLEQSKTIVAQDELGNQARLIVSPGAGILLDAGNYATAHYDVGKNKLTEYLEKHERIMPGLYELTEHNGINCSTKKHYRTKVNRASLEENLDYEASPNSIGHTLTVDIQPPSVDGEVCQVELFNKKLSRLKVSLKKDGTFEVSSKAEVTIESNKDTTIKSNKDTTVKSKVDTSVHANGTVYLGKEKGGGNHQKVAMAPATKGNDQKIKGAFDAHTHLYVLPLIPIATIPTATPIPQSPNLANVGADNTKAKKDPV